MPRQYSSILNCYLFLLRMCSSHFPTSSQVPVQARVVGWLRDRNSVLEDRKLGAELSWGHVNGAVLW